MSTRVTVNNKEYHGDPGARLRPFHKPLPDIDAKCMAIVDDHGRACGRNVYFIVTDRHPEDGYDDGYWRHEPGTFWTSR